MKIKITTKMIVAAGLFSALSALFQLVHIGYPTPWGMWIDIVSVPIMIAYFAYGFWTALITSMVTGMIITFFDPTSIIGAIMKFTSTLPMFLIPAFFVHFFKEKKNLEKPMHFLPILVLAIALRCMLMLPLNYYWAIPLWTQMSPEQAMAVVPPFILIGLNALQGTIEFSIAWYIVFKTRVRSLL